jgi:hypothetical protein
MTQTITVIKRNFRGGEIWRYTGILIRRAGTVLHLEALFNGPETRSQARAALEELQTLFRAKHEPGP